MSRQKLVLLKRCTFSVATSLLILHFIDIPTHGPIIFNNCFVECRCNFKSLCVCFYKLAVYFGGVFSSFADPQIKLSQAGAF